MERMMKVQEVILKAMAGSLKWWEAAETIGVSDRTMRRWRERYQKCGYDGLYDRRKRRGSEDKIAGGSALARFQKWSAMGAERNRYSECASTNLRARSFFL